MTTLDESIVDSKGGFSSVKPPLVFRKLRIVILGNHNVNYSTESDLAWTFEHLGHEVIRLQENVDTTETLLQQGNNADLIIWLHTHNWNMRGRYRLNAIINNLKMRKPVIAYHLDLWLGIQRQTDLRNSIYFKVGHFFTVDKLMAEFMNRNPKYPIGHFLKAGVVERDCYAGKKRKEYSHEVAFVGSKIYHKEWQYRPRLINFLSDTYKDDFAHYGSGGRPNVRGIALNELYASTKIIVGDTLCKNFVYPEYLSDRIFETTGRGGFMIHPYIKGIEDSFVIDEEIVTYTFGDFKELKSKIDYYLKHDKEREKIRKAGMKRTQSEHTYTNRVKQIIKEMDLQ